MTRLETMAGMMEEISKHILNGGRHEIQDTVRVYLGSHIQGRHSAHRSLLLPDTDTWFLTLAHPSHSSPINTLRGFAMSQSLLVLEVMNDWHKAPWVSKQTTEGNIHHTGGKTQRGGVLRGVTLPGRAVRTLLPAPAAFRLHRPRGGSATSRGSTRSSSLNNDPF